MSVMSRLKVVSTAIWHLHGFWSWVCRVLRERLLWVFSIRVFFFVSSVCTTGRVKRNTLLLFSNSEPIRTEIDGWLFSRENIHVQM